MKPSDSNRTSRTFIAIPLPENISLFLGKTQDKIRETGFRTSYTKKSAMHLTLRFMGNTPDHNIKKIIQAMAATAAACAPFTLCAKGVGVFPGIKKARVIWSGVKGEINRLETVQTTLEKNLARAGLTADNRRFSPHFTLGRFKGRVDTKMLATIIQTLESCESTPCVIKFMVLFKSDLTPLGAVHTPLFKAEFAGNPTGPPEH